MANKLTIAEVAQIIADGYTAESTTFNPTYEEASGLLDKLAGQFMIKSGEVDKLAVFDDIMLPYGTTLEEYFVEMLAVLDFDPTSVPWGKEKASVLKRYHYRNSDKKIELPLSKAQYARAFVSPSAFGDFEARLLARIQDSKNIYKFQAKKHAIGMQLANISNVANPNLATMYLTLAKPTDLASAKAWIKKVKELLEDLSFVSTKYNLAGVLKSSQPEDMIMLIRKGTLPTVAVELLATAFHNEELDPRITQIVIDDFGLDETGTELDAKAWCMITENKSIRYITTRSETGVDINNNSLQALTTHHFGENIVVSDFANTIVLHTA